MREEIVTSPLLALERYLERTSYSKSISSTEKVLQKLGTKCGLKNEQICKPYPNRRQKPKVKAKQF